MQMKTTEYIQDSVPTSSRNHGKPGKSLKKVPCMEKIMEFEKPLNNHGKIIGILWNSLKKPPVARKVAVRHTKLVCLTASFLATDGFKFWLFKNAHMIYKHAYLNTLLLLHSAFILSAVKVPLKGEVVCHALNSHGNYIVDHRKSWNLCFWISVGTLQEVNTEIANCKQYFIWTILSSEKRVFTLLVPFKCRTKNFAENALVLNKTCAEYKKYICI